MFRKSTLSGGWDDNCVEVDTANAPQVIRVRDSKDPEGPVLEFDEEEWKAFIEGVKNGEFDI